MIRAEEYCLVEWKNRIQVVVQSTCSGLVSLHLKGTVPDKLFAASKNWLNPWRVRPSPSQGGSRYQKIKSTENEKI